jgi:hypothetical protein
LEKPNLLQFCPQLKILAITRPEFLDSLDAHDQPLLNRLELHLMDIDSKKMKQLIAWSYKQACVVTFKFYRNNFDYGGLEGDALATLHSASCGKSNIKNCEFVCAKGFSIGLIPRIEKQFKQINSRVLYAAAKTLPRFSGLPISQIDKHLLIDLVTKFLR